MAVSVNLAPNGMSIGQGTLVFGLAADLVSKQALTFDANGNLNVNVQVGGGGGGGSSTVTASGTLINNNASPIADNIGVLPAVANAAAQSWTEGNQVLLSTDLSGALRVVIPGTVNVIAAPAQASAAAPSFTEGDVVLLSTDLAGNLRVTGSSTVSGTVSAAQSGLWTVTANQGGLWTVAANVLGTVTVSGSVSALVVGTKINNNSSAGDSLNLGVLPAVANAAAPSWTENKEVFLSTDLAGNLRVTGSSTVSGTVSAAQSGLWTVTSNQGGLWTVTANILAGTVTANVQGTVTANVQGTVTANVQGTVSAAQSGTWTERIVGNAGANLDAATAAAVPANALYAGLRGTTAYPTAVTDGQMVGAMGDKAGRLITVAVAPRDLIGTAAFACTATAAATVIAAGAAGIFNDLVSVTLTNESSTATIVTLSDGTTSYKFAIAANGGGTFNYPTPLPAVSAATAWTVLNSAAVTVDCVMMYVKNK